MTATHGMDKEYDAHSQYQRDVVATAAAPSCCHETEGDERWTDCRERSR